MSFVSRMEHVRLHILGGVDDEEYAKECYDLVKQMELQNIIFTGRVDIQKYMEKLDFTILTSISEGQPLSVLESMAARRPVSVQMLAVAGNCWKVSRVILLDLQDIVCRRCIGKGWRDAMEKNVSFKKQETEDGRKRKKTCGEVFPA